VEFKYFVNDKKKVKNLQKVSHTLSVKCIFNILEDFRRPENVETRLQKAV